MKHDTLFPASVVGSLPRPRFVQDVVLRGHAFSETLDNAVLCAIALQEQAGLDIISDGEWRRKSYIGVIADVARGFKHFFQDGKSCHTVIAPLQYDHPGFAAREVRFVKLHTTRKVKVCLPSPYLVGERMWDPDQSRHAYPTRRAFMDALVPIVRNEVLLARDAGADIVQIDDPHICLFVDEELRATFTDPEEELAYACGLVHEVVKGIDGVDIALHLCRRNKGRRGWIGRGGYDPIIPHISLIDIDQVTLEYTIPVAGDMSALAKLPKKFAIGLGCVDCRFDHIDTPEEIVTRVESALHYIDPDRIILNPDCGFAPGSQAEIPLDEAYLKLKNEVEAALILRWKHGFKTVS